MENKELPGQEEELRPETIPEGPQEPAIPENPAAEPADETPVILDLTMAPLPKEEEDIPSTEETVPAEETASVEPDDLPAEESASEETDAAPAEEPSVEEAVAVPTEEIAADDAEAEPAEETAAEDADAEPAEETAAEDPEAAPTEESEAAQESADTAPEASQSRDGAAFMASIPDVDDDYPQEEPEFAEDPVDQDFRDADAEFDAMFAAPAEEATKPEKPRPTHKGRPKRRKGEGLLGIPSILVTVVWLALILVIGVTAGRMLWVCAADVLAFGREDKPVTITVYEADTMEDIVDKLYNNGLIRYKSLFNFYASISDAEEDIQPGIYDLNTRYDYHALVNFMSPKSSREVVELTIPEGYTCRQIFALLEENRVCTAVDAAAYAADGELDEYWFLEGVQRGSENSLEGFLFPDTYEFYKNSSPREALQKMLDNFDYRFTEDMRAQLDTLNETLTGDYTIREVAIVASLIEKESASPEESPKIAGVIYNRLFRWGDNPKLLGIDAAIVYAQEGQNTRIDTSIDSPYNTYRNPGLTPGPIANPGLSSLKAALNPETHGYYYYVLNPSTGMHQFSTTQAEHDAWIDQFYRG